MTSDIESRGRKHTLVVEHGRGREDNAHRMARAANRQFVLLVAIKAHATDGEFAGRHAQVAPLVVVVSVQLSDGRPRSIHELSFPDGIDASQGAGLAVGRKGDYHSYSRHKKIIRACLDDETAVRARNCRFHVRPNGDRRGLAKANQKGVSAERELLRRQVDGAAEVGSRANANHQPGSLAGENERCQLIDDRVDMTQRLLLGGL